MKVEIFHNISRDAGFGLNVMLTEDYAETPEQRHELVLVFESDPKHAADRVSDSLQRLLADAFATFNVGSDELAARYRARGLRSLSVGDVVVIDGDAYACASVGWDGPLHSGDLRCWTPRGPGSDPRSVPVRGARAAGRVCPAGHAMNGHRNRTVCAAVTMLVILAVLWLVQFANVADHYMLDPDFGIHPHAVGSLPDILSAPFLHLSWAHIEGNSLPLLVLGFLAAFRSMVKFAGFTIVVILTSGLAVWLTAPAGSYTVGASGVIFGWFGYVMVRGFFDRRVSDMVIGVVVAVYYAGVFTLLMPAPGLSWQDHMGGLLGGLVCGWLFRAAGHWLSRLCRRNHDGAADHQRLRGADRGRTVPCGDRDPGPAGPQSQGPLPGPWHWNQTRQAFVNRRRPDHG